MATNWRIQLHTSRVCKLPLYPRAEFRAHTKGAHGDRETDYVSRVSDQLRRSLRLAELRKKHGTAHEDIALPAWLDTLEGAMAERQAGAGDPFNARSLVKPKPEPRVRIPMSTARKTLGMDIPG